MPGDAQEDGEDADDDSSSDTGDDGGSDEENVSPQNGSGSRKKTGEPPLCFWTLQHSSGSKDLKKWTLAC